MEFRTEEEILEEMLSKGQERNLLSMDENIIDKILEGENTENQYVLDLSTHAYTSSSLEDKAEEIYLGCSVDTATGEQLDRIGEKFGVFRSPATASIVDVDVSMITTSENPYYLPMGTKLELDPVTSSNTIVTYTLMDDYTIPAGVESMTVKARSDDLGSTTQLPAYSVIGLEGIADVTATNYVQSSGGRDIEEDDDYRQRIKNWSAKTVRGSRAQLEDYLLHLDNLKDYRLLPLWDGVGTLKIICDCLPSELETIREGVQENCMLFTDDPCVCVLVEEQQLESISLTCWLGSYAPNGMTLDELSQLITGQVRVFVEGGTSRSGSTVKGIGIGGEFDPSRLIAFLHNEIPEVNNIKSNLVDVIQVEELCRFHISNVEVTYEWSENILTTSQTT